ncbi:MAG: diaminopimelate decarboxylase [Chloroflexi bacterium]|nr:diaminopimelate decarboxylase [Chloroflexota bacterium]
MLNDSFRYVNDQLACDGVPLCNIIAAHGTPTYVYSANRITQNAQRLQRAFSSLRATLHYSLKANNNLAIIRLLADLGLGMDAVSAGEIYRAEQAGVDPSHIVFAGVGKTRDELQYALQAGVGWFNVESHGELLLLNQLAGDLQKRPSVALRLNPDVQAKTHHHIATGHFGAKFGMSADTIAHILAHRDETPHLTIHGLHVHIGSQLGDVDETIEAVRRAQHLAEPYPDIRTLNIGGGFPVRYVESDEYPQPENFAEALAPVLKGWQVMMEPGRSIVADAGVLLISVLYIKDQAGQHFAITDGSMTELIRPALYEAVHPILPLKNAPPTQKMIIVGPVCESTDVLNRGTMLPVLETGDQLAVMGTGAYGMVMASNYNMRTRPAEILVEGEQWRVVRRRETWDDLLRQELSESTYGKI